MFLTFFWQFLDNFWQFFGNFLTTLDSSNIFNIFDDFYQSPSSFCRPFNFIGMLDDLEVEELNKLLQKNKETGANHTIWFGHFPTSCILSPGVGVRKIIARDKTAIAYVCGHLHRLGGLVPKMYSMQREGFLELELGDWKDNRV